MARSRNEIFEEVRRSADDDHFPYRDARVMVTMLGIRRLESAEFESENSATEYAATVLCFIFDPVKTRRSDYPGTVRGFRRQFEGIAEDIGLQRAFAATFTEGLLTARSVQEAIEGGFDALFVPQFQLRGG